MDVLIPSTSYLKGTMKNAFYGQENVIGMLLAIQVRDP
jgi:hypothetical protein